MKTRTFRKSVKTLFAILLCACALRGLKPVIGFAASSYPNAAKYTVGDAEIKKTVKNLDVDWVSGKVIIEYHSDNTVILQETSKKKLSDDMQMRWWLDGDTLRVRFSKPGFHRLNMPEKILTITFPEGSKFDEVSIHTTSGDVKIPLLQADSLDLNVTSGVIQAVAEAQRIAARATSGDLSLRFTGKAKEIAVETTSGELDVAVETADRLSSKNGSGKSRVKAESIGELQAVSTSGEIRAEVRRVKQVTINTTSGEIDASIEKFDTISISSTSGDVSAALSAKPGFTAKLSVTSGEISYDLPLTKEGKTFICGDGSGEVSISTTSGDITLK